MSGRVVPALRLSGAAFTLLPGRCSHSVGFPKEGRDLGQGGSLQHGEPWRSCLLTHSHSWAAHGPSRAWGPCVPVVTLVIFSADPSTPPARAAASFWSLSTDSLGFGCRGLDCHVNTLVVKDPGSSVVGPYPPLPLTPSILSAPGVPGLVDIPEALPVKTMGSEEGECSHAGLTPMHGYNHGAKA